MYKLCKTEQSAARQRQLEQGLLQAMLVRRYEEISISDLCGQMALPRKSFYRYFSGKDGALHALIDHTMLEYESFPHQEKPGERPDLNREMERFFQFWKSRRDFLDALVRSNLTPVLMSRAIEMAKKSMGMPIRFKSYEDQVAQEYTMVFGICGIMAMVLHWHQEGFTPEPGKLARIAVNLLAQPLFLYME